MKLPRRNFLRMTASAVALSALPSLASALDYPTRPVHVVVGFPYKASFRDPKESGVTE